MMSFTELEQDLWTVPADAVVITTNGFIKKNGEVVMGRGCAREAQRFLTPAAFGARLLKRGNHVQLFKDRVYAAFREGYQDLVTFPVKHNWWEPADPKLVDRSAVELRQLADCMGWERVVLPRPGCGNGGLSWFGTVRPIIWRTLDERFIVVHQLGDEEESEEVDI